MSEVHPHYSLFQHFIPLEDWIVFHHLDRPHFVCLFTCWWTVGLFPPFGYCKEQHHYQHSQTSIFLTPVFNSLGYVSRSRIAGSYGILCLTFWGAARLSITAECEFLFLLSCMTQGYFLVAQMVKSLPAVWETRVWSQGLKDPLEKKMATHSSTLAWKIPWTEEPGRLQSMGLQRVRCDWETSLWLKEPRLCPWPSPVPPAGYPHWFGIVPGLVTTMVRSNTQEWSQLKSPILLPPKAPKELCLGTASISVAGRNTSGQCPLVRLSMLSAWLQCWEEPGCFGSTFRLGQGCRMVFLSIDPGFGAEMGEGIAAHPSSWCECWPGCLGESWTRISEEVIGHDCSLDPGSQRLLPPSSVPGLYILPIVPTVGTFPKRQPWESNVSLRLTEPS